MDYQRKIWAFIENINHEKEGRVSKSNDKRPSSRLLRPLVKGPKIMLSWSDRSHWDVKDVEDHIKKYCP